MGYEEEVFPPEGGDTLNRLPKEAVDGPISEGIQWHFCGTFVLSHLGALSHCTLLGASQ